MKNLFLKWRGRGAALLLAASAVAAQAAPEVQTLGGGPNLASPAKSGSTDGDTFTYAKFRNPFGMAFDTNGNILIADQGNNKIRKVTNPGEGDSLTSTFATGMRAPVSVAVDSSNYVYVVSQGDGRLRKYDGFGTLVQTISGFRSPTALALGSTGTVYVVELSGRLFRVQPSGSSELVNVPLFNRPRGLAFVRGLLAVTESGSHRVTLVNLATDTVVSTIGSTRGFFDGPANLAKFNQPYGIAAAPNGALVVADRANNRLRVIDTNNAVTTLYGVPASSWFKPFAGWVDGAGGDSGVAATRLPSGVLVSSEGIVYNTETYWDLLREVTDAGLGISGVGSGISTNVVNVDGTNVVLVGTNFVSLGFASGEGSSDFVGAAGQTFFVPTTLTIAPGQPMYSFQMSLSVTGETGVAVDPFESRYASMLLKPSGVANIFTPIYPNYHFLNSSLNLLGIGWLERRDQTNLYPANAQDLITYSLAKNTAFDKGGNKIILGAYGFKIPTTALESDTFRVAMRNPSGSSDGVSQPVSIRVLTENGLGAGTLNTIKRVTLASRPYMVGDSTPFRWLNAGEFGDFQLVNTDVADLFQTVEYQLNGLANRGLDGVSRPLRDSDLFNALDSSDGSSPTVSFGDDVSINNVISWDGSLNVDDLWVTFRRSLDPSLKWFARYWSNGVLNVVEVPNGLASGFGTAAAPAKTKSAAKTALVGPRPAARLTSGDALASAGQTLEIPIQLSITLGYAARVAIVSVSLQPLDGSPAITVPVQFSTTPAFQNPEFINSRGPNHYAAAWLNHTIPGVSGDSLFAILTVQVPANAGSRAAYRVTFNHFSASPNGVALFDASTSPGLILLSDRSASTWNDGIADAWRLRFFGSISASDSAVSADADGDGVINWTEYQNGTDPTDVNSH
jgi:streptogramin lyase